MGGNDPLLKEKLKDAIIANYLFGMTLHQIGKWIGRNRQTIHNWLVEWDVPRRNVGPVVTGKGFKYNHWALDIKRRYGITVDQYETLYAEQNGVCAICLKKCPSRERLGVDHCHSTMKVRGLLCVKCNNAVGLFNDDPIIARRAADYLSK